MDWWQSAYERSASKYRRDRALPAVRVATVVVLLVACGSDHVGSPSQNSTSDEVSEALYVGGSAAAGVDGFAVMPSLVLAAGVGQAPGTFNMLVRGPEVGQVEVISLRAQDGRVVSRRDVDPVFASDTVLCMTSDATVVGVGGVDGITVRIQGDGDVIVGELSSAHGWFESLRCGDENVFLITSYGAVFVLDGSGMPTGRVLPLAPISDRESLAISVVEGVDAGRTMVVAGPGPRAITSTTLPGVLPGTDGDGSPAYAAPLDGDIWESPPVGLLQRRWGESGTHS